MSLRAQMGEEIDAIMARDPAARSRLEVVLCYPGFHALQFHRLAHFLWRRGWYLAGRFVSHLGRFLTAIEIHPGARVGRRLFIDHGVGAVIGETAEIGDDVTLYHGVTLGGISLEKGKRHPTLGNGVIVGAGAQVLGPIRVGDGARIGANAVVLKEVPPGATMIGVAARPAQPRGQRPALAAPAFDAYGTPDCDDPLVRTLDAMHGEIAELRARLARLEDGAPSRELVVADQPRVPAPANGGG